MLINKTLYSLNDVTIIPSAITRVRHRQECNVLYDNETLPLFTAPMSCVIDENNWELFRKHGINTIIPRSVSINKRISLMYKTWIAVSLQEFKEEILDKIITTDITMYILIDIANGHMQELLNVAKIAKERYINKIQLMVGNIANPEIYRKCAEIGIDYIRIGIGSGNVCTTSANSGCHYPMASLINDVVEEKNLLISSYGNKPLPKIVADGGFKNFDQINKALALGADYIMLGEIFAKTEEACGETRIELDGKKRLYYGMSTRKAQKEFGGAGTKTAEGIEKWVTISYTLERWINNFKHWLREAMSLTDAFTLDEFKTKTNLTLMSSQSYKSYWK